MKTEQDQLHRESDRAKKLALLGGILIISAFAVGSDLWIPGMVLGVTGALTWLFAARDFINSNKPLFK